jgi:hypothetical protein
MTMKPRHSQEGLTLLGFAIVVVVVGIFTLVGVRLFPIYSEYYNVVGAMENLKNQPEIAQKSPPKIKEIFFRKLYVNYVESVEKKNVLVSRTGGLHIRVKYEVRRPMVGNLDVVASFDKKVMLTES